MLSFIHIENVALIKQLDLDFNRGFTAMTGETGSGKSMIIDSINFALGQRPRKDIIRNGEEECYVYLLFSLLPDETINLLASEYSLSVDDDRTIMISRKYSADGKSVSKINNRTVPISTVKMISSYLISINEQHDAYSLLNESMHIDFLDKYAISFDDSFKALFFSYNEAYKLYINAKNRLSSFLNDSKDREQKIDFLKFQKSEIESAKIKIGEEEKLTSEREIIKNSELISNAVKGSLTLLSGGVKPGAYDKITSASDNIEKIKDFVPNGSELHSKLLNILFDLEDVIKTISLIDTGAYSDPHTALDNIESRLDLISRLKNKYGDTEKEIIDFYNDISNQISEFEQYDFTVAEYERELSESKQNLLLIGNKLNQSRKKIAEKLTAFVNEEFVFLDMDKVKFDVVFTHLAEPSAKGLEDISFYIATNPGEPYKKLSTVASGGELSRVMLALKKVLSIADSVDCIIFDEIDTGVSGKTSSKIGISLKALSNKAQVICVTHSAQVSAIANEHYKILKEEVSGRMFTKVHLLEGEERVNEIARILGGVTITDSVIKTATELIQQGNNI